MHFVSTYVQTMTNQFFPLQVRSPVLLVVELLPLLVSFFGTLLLGIEVGDSNVIAMVHFGITVILFFCMHVAC